jgi:hypothetical protein
MPAAELQEGLTACYPLHPLTALVLGPLFRRLAQNERSLFAFLASSEPFGFQEFLRENTLKGGPYRLDRLYDFNASVTSLPRYDVSYPAGWIRYIARITRDEVEMHMLDSLPRDHSNINAYVVSTRCQIVIQEMLHPAK